MKSVLSRLGILTLLLIAGGALPVQAQTVIPVLDIGAFDGYDNPDTGAEYSGTGFVGMFYEPTFGAQSFVHLFGAEPVSSRTALQVDISGLSGMTINNAFLMFDLFDGSDTTGTMNLTSFDADGTLGYDWNPISPLGTTSYTVAGSGANDLDVTTFLRDRVASGESWFGLYLQDPSDHFFTYTFTDDGTTFQVEPDRAQVRLEINRPTAPVVPEPGALALFLPGLAALGFAARRRRTIKL